MVCQALVLGWLGSRCEFNEHRATNPIASHGRRHRGARNSMRLYCTRTSAVRIADAEIDIIKKLGARFAQKAIKLIQAITARTAFITHLVCSALQVAARDRHVRCSVAIE